MNASSCKERLVGYFRAGVSAVNPSRLVAAALRQDVSSILLSVDGAPDPIPCERLKKIFVVGGGKAGRTMGDAALRVLGDRVTEGVLAVPHGSGGTSGPLRFLEAAHPGLDIENLAVAREILALVEKAGADDLVIALLSGGGSSMISAPAAGVTAEQKAGISRLLLQAGADIHSFNTVRKHLSEIKGGLLARAAWPATVWALLLSDVPGDDPSVIASGPFTPDPTTYADAIGVLEQHGLLYAAPAAIRWRLMEGAADRLPDTPKPGDPAFQRVFQTLIGTNRTAMDAVSEAAARDGAEVILLPGFLRGKAHLCARAFCNRLRDAAAALSPGRTVVLIAGGETTVHVQGDGNGGRCQEFALASAIELSGANELAVLAGGTDGVDGPTDAAGAYANDSTAARAKAFGLDPRAHLLNNDAYPFFKALDDLIVTGPTGTNVTDLVIGLAHSPASEDNTLT